MSKQPEALRLADALASESESDARTVKYSTAKKSANELRRLHALNAELLEALKGVLEVFAKPYNETLLEVIAARAAIAKATGEQK